MSQPASKAIAGTQLIEHLPYELDGGIASRASIGLIVLATDYTIEQIERAGYRLLTPRDPVRRAGIVTFSVPGTAPDALHRALLARRVLCAPRGGGIRFSPHFYTPLEVIDRAIAVVSEVAQGFHS